MTNTEAISILNGYDLRSKAGVKGLSALDLGIEAIKKQIPKKVRVREPASVKAFDGTDKVHVFRCYPCPVCGKWIADNEGHKHCEWCGQALDWGEINE